MNKYMHKCVNPKDVRLSLINFVMSVIPLHHSLSIKRNFMGSDPGISYNSNILYFYIITYVTKAILINVGNASTNNLEVEN